MLFVLLYFIGMLVTARHNIYRIRVDNENRIWMDQVIGPRVMGSEDYRQMHLELLSALRNSSEGRQRIRNHDAGDLAFRLDPYSQATKYPSDYVDIFLHAALFPLYWLRYLVQSSGRLFVKSVSKQTPGEIRDEQERREWEAAYRRMKIQHLYEETERLRKEQDDV